LILYDSTFTCGTSFADYKASIDHKDSEVDSFCRFEVLGERLGGLELSDDLRLRVVYTDFHVFGDDTRVDQLALDLPTYFFS